MVGGVCVCLAGYYRTGGSSSPCATCNYINTHCTSCSSLSTCTGCASGYYVSGSTTCATCSSSISHCTSCSSNGLTCLGCLPISFMSLYNGTCVCDDGYYFSSGFCIPCPDAQCQRCQIQSSALACL